MSGGLWSWVRPRLAKSLAYGGGLGAVAGLAPGALVGVASWSAGDAVAWGLLWALGGVAGGLLRGWQPAYRLSHWIKRTIGWHRFWPLVGILAGAGTGGLLGLLFGWWLILPVFLGLILGGWLGAAAGRKVWLAGRRVGWERIWAVGGTLAAGATGFLLARWASASGLGALADHLAGEAAFWMIDHSASWGLVWTLIGAAGGALGGAVAGIFSDLLARFSGLLD
jgi:hypothetical protein